MAEREVFWNINQVWVFYLFAVLSVSIFISGCCRNFWIWSKGWPSAHKMNYFQAFSAVIKKLFGNSKIFAGDLFGGLTHIFIMWGFFVLFIGTVLSALNDYVFHYLYGSLYLYYSLALDIMGLIFISGLIMAALRRYVIKAGKMINLLEDPLVLLLLIAIGITGYLIEGYRLKAAPEPWLIWQPVGVWLARLLPGDALHFHVITWWIHAALSFIFIAYIPFSKLFHVIAGSLNIALSTLPSEVLTFEEREKMSHEFSRQHLVAADACVRCNRCETKCPSNLSGEALSPRVMNQKIKAYVQSKYSISRLINYAFKKPVTEVSNAEIIQGEEAWMCSTCGACFQECPVSGNPMDVISEVRRSKINEGIQIPKLIGTTLEAIFKNGNPYKGSKLKRTAWTKDLGIKDLSKGGQAEMLYYVGCGPAYDNRLQEIARSVAGIFSKLGLDFGTLGNKESCCGDIARRIGEQGLLEELITKSYKSFSEHGITDIVVTCPHGLKMFRDEYPLYKKKLEIESEEIHVQHYIELIAKMLQDNRIEIAGKLEKSVTYHDPCYLGRHCGIYDAPRTVIRKIPGINFVEMKRNRQNSFCCGGGGGRIWMEEFETKEKIPEIRIREAAEAGAELIITACPFCLSMLEDAVKTSGFENKIEVRDLAEVLVHLDIRSKGAQ